MLKHGKLTDAGADPELGDPMYRLTLPGNRDRSAVAKAAAQHEVRRRAAEAAAPRRTRGRPGWRRRDFDPRWSEACARAGSSDVEIVAGYFRKLSPDRVRREPVIGIEVATLRDLVRRRSLPAGHPEAMPE